ncbi:MAG: ABC transporter permease subunit [bacterium]|nr:ABC transporter permease subunit [bacterium]MCY4257024.1 ABC transporter permease subunit [bacterium]
MPSEDPLVRDQRSTQQATSEARRDALARMVRKTVTFVVFLALLAGLYTGYKAFGQAIDDAQQDWAVVGSVLPRTDNLNMPPLSEIFGQFGETPGGQDQIYIKILFDEALFTLREAAVGFVVGLIIGMAIALVLAQWRRLEQGLLPYVIASQTIPLIAIAPIIVIWGRKNFDVFPWEWQNWMSVAIIATYLTFFPVAVNGLRGLQAARPENKELMASYAANWGQTLWRLRLPASLPYLFAAFKIAATSSIVGAIVGEISAGVEGGLGRRILREAFNYTTGPDRLFASVLGAAVLGIFVFLVVIGVERLVVGRQGKGAVV